MPAATTDTALLHQLVSGNWLQSDCRKLALVYDEDYRVAALVYTRPDDPGLRTRLLIRSLNGARFVPSNGVLRDPASLREAYRVLALAYEWVRTFLGQED